MIFKMLNYDNTKHGGWRGQRPGTRPNHPFGQRNGFFMQRQTIYFVCSSCKDRQCPE